MPFQITFPNSWAMYVCFKSSLKEFLRVDEWKALLYSFKSAKLKILILRYLKYAKHCNDFQA